MSRQREAPDAKAWAQHTGLVCFCLLCIGFLVQGQVDGDVMRWRGFDLIGLYSSIAYAVGSASVYVALHERR